jgi:hypothetical protein
LIGGHDFIESIGDLAFDTQMIAGHSHREVTASHRLQRLKQFLRRVRFSIGVWFGFGAAPGRWRNRADITHGIPPQAERRAPSRRRRAIVSHDKIVRTIGKQENTLYYSLLDR